jgi:hypothetical protein
MQMIVAKPETIAATQQSTRIILRRGTMIQPHPENGLFYFTQFLTFSKINHDSHHFITITQLTDGVQTYFGTAAARSAQPGRAFLL